MALNEASTRIDLRVISPPARLAAATYASHFLRSGQAMEVTHDQDPVDILGEFERKSDRFGWEYLERGPAVWRVRVTRVHGTDASRSIPATADERSRRDSVLAPA